MAIWKLRTQIRIPTWLVALLCGFLCFGVLLWGPEWLVNRYAVPGQSLSRLEYSTLVDDYRKTLAQILGGVALLSGLYFTAQNTRLSEDGRITDRFSKAVDQLGARTQDGNPLLEIRLGALYALQRLARDSRRDRDAIIDISCAYVRQNAPRQWAVWNPESEEEPREPSRQPPRIDITTILNFLGTKGTLDADRAIDLSATELCRADLMRGNLPKVNFRGTFLQDANFMSSNLQGTDFSRAHCVRANFVKANLSGASFVDVNAFAATFEGSTLSGVAFRKANLEGAVFRDAIFATHRARPNDFSDANLCNADLRGCNLSDAVGLTADQLAQAIIDDRTQVPREQAR